MTPEQAKAPPTKQVGPPSSLPCYNNRNSCVSHKHPFTTFPKHTTPPSQNIRLCHPRRRLRTHLRRTRSHQSSQASGTPCVRCSHCRRKPYGLSTDAAERRGRHPLTSSCGQPHAPPLSQRHGLQGQCNRPRRTSLSFHHPKHTHRRPNTLWPSRQSNLTYKSTLSTLTR